MITSTKADFRINLKTYSSIRPQTPRIASSYIKTHLKYLQKAVSTQKSSVQHSSIISPEPPPKLPALMHTTQTLYRQNLQFYKLNQQKLLKTIQNQMREKNYVYQRLIIKALINKQKPLIREGATINYDKLEQQLEILNKFLEELYERKRIKEILIVSEKLKEEEKTVGDRAGFGGFEGLDQDLDCMEQVIYSDFISEYQNICMKFGTAQPNLKPHIHIKNQIQTSRQDLRSYFEKKKKQKFKYVYLRKINQG